MNINGYSTKIRINGWIKMDILLKLKEMDGYRWIFYKNQDRWIDIDGYSTKIKRDGWRQMDILLKLGQMDRYRWIFS